MAMRNLNALWICLGAADQRENSQCVFSRINPSLLAGIQTTGWKGGDNPVQVWSRVLSIEHKIIRLFFRELGPCFSLKLRGRWKKKKKGGWESEFCKWSNQYAHITTSLPACLPAFEHLTFVQTVTRRAAISSIAVPKLHPPNLPGLLCKRSAEPKRSWSLQYYISLGPISWLY